jgi:hypothetical protein
MRSRYDINALNRPMSVYEMHFGSWARSPESPDEFLSYRQMAEKLIPYLSGNRIYSCRISSINGTSILSFMGVSDYRIFCCQLPDMELRRI